MESVVQTGEYRFSFAKKETAVVFEAVRVDRQEIMNNDVERILEYFKDIGKWETVIKALSDLIREIGFPETVPDIKTPAHDYKAYNYNIENKEGVVKGSIHLTKEERHSREDSGRELLSVNEIILPFQNIDKWRNLQRTISSLRQNARC